MPKAGRIPSWLLASRKQKSAHFVRLIMAAVVAATSIVACHDTGSHRGATRAPSTPAATSPAARVAPIPVSAADCLARPAAVRTAVPGTVAGQYRVDRPVDDATYDLRTATFTGDGTVTPGTSTPLIYPLLLGKAKPASAMCVIGGSVSGTMSRSMTWPELKAEERQPNGTRTYYDGAALTEFARGDAGHLVDGFRADNVSDGIAARGSFTTTATLPLDGGNAYFRNLYLSSIHDDCIDINDLVSGAISDSLLDGCYTGISERPDRGSQLLKYHAPAGQFSLDHVLLRMMAFPGPHPTPLCPTGTPSGYNAPFKWSANANRLVMQNSMLLLERPPCSDRYFPFPSHTSLRNVTIVWAGHGRWRWDRPPGVRITTDRTVWQRARLAWLARHGCPETAPDIAATENPCANLTTAVAP